MRRHIPALALVLSLAWVLSFGAGDPEMMGGGSYRLGGDCPCLTESERTRVKAMLQQNMETLRARRLLPPIVKVVAGGFGWPLRVVAGFSDYGYYNIGPLLDHDPRAGVLLDYECGNRTYDGHWGADYGPWPFAWNHVDANTVQVVSVAEGTIIGKEDGNYDRNCACTDNRWNAVFIRHADGSQTWYGHLKKGSLTTKGIGETVAAGEYLGVIGSSGCSTGAHLHFEVHDSKSLPADPCRGACNDSPTWWTAQRPYFDSAINKLATHSKPPIFNPCPNPDIPNLGDIYAPGDLGVFAAYYRDQLKGQVTKYTIYRPDGSVFNTWSHTPPDQKIDYYSASWWWFGWYIPNPAPLGAWKFEAVYQGQTYQHTFWVAKSTQTSTDILLGLGTGGDGFIEIRADAGSAYQNKGWIQLPWPAYNQSNGETRPATGDMDGDGWKDLIVGLGSGGNGWLEVRQDSRNNYAHKTWIQVPWPAYNAANGSTTPAVGDLDGNGKNEMAIGLGSGGAGWVEIRSDAGAEYEHRAWLQVPWAAYNSAEGSTQPAIGDLDGDGKNELVLGLGSGAEGWIEIRGDAGSGYAHKAWLQVPWPAYNGINGATRPACLDVNRDGRKELVIGLGNGSDGWVEIRGYINSAYANMASFQVAWTAYNNLNGTATPAP